MERAAPSDGRSRPEPTPEFEDRYGGSNFDPATLSINTTRGRAFHAVIGYAAWCQKNLAAQPRDERADAPRGFSDIPEVREILENHLDPSCERSLAVRAVYGWRYGTLLFIDSGWAVRNKERIFPPVEELADYRRAAWNAFVQFNQPHTKYIEVLQDEYKLAVECIGHTTLSRSWAGNPGERLAEHLMTYYWRGDLSLDSPLVKGFLETAPGELREHAIAFIGRSLHNTSGRVPKEVIERLMALWEDRLVNARKAKSVEPFRQEIAAFGWWLASGKMPEDWALEQLAQVIDLTGDVKPGHMVVEWLDSMSKKYPREAVSLLAALVEEDSRGWGIHLWRENARRIIEVALASENRDARQEARELINRLASRGHLEFRELLN